MAPPARRRPARAAAIAALGLLACKPAATQGTGPSGAVTTSTQQDAGTGSSTDDLTVVPPASMGLLAKAFVPDAPPGVIGTGQASRNHGPKSESACTVGQMFGEDRNLLGGFAVKLCTAAAYFPGTADGDMRLADGADAFRIVRQGPATDLYYCRGGALVTHIHAQSKDGSRFSGSFENQQTSALHSGEPYVDGMSGTFDSRYTDPARIVFAYRTQATSSSNTNRNEDHLDLRYDGASVVSRAGSYQRPDGLATYAVGIGKADLAFGTFRTREYEGPATSAAPSRSVPFDAAGFVLPPPLPAAVEPGGDVATADGELPTGFGPDFAVTAPSGWDCSGAQPAAEAPSADDLAACKSLDPELPGGSCEDPGIQIDRPDAGSTVTFVPF